MFSETRVVNCRKDQFDIYIGRPSIFGNPFIIGKDGDRLKVIEKYEKYFLDRIKTDKEFKNKVLQLKGKRLGCFCSPQACHGDVIVNWIDNIGE